MLIEQHMTLTREQIKAAALELDPLEREALAEELLLSIGSAQQEEIDQAWLAESRRREADFRAGKTGAKPMDEVLDRIARKARP
jgi:putative addiction module component (TIGR02574 family)